MHGVVRGPERMWERAVAVIFGTEPRCGGHDRQRRCWGMRTGDSKRVEGGDFEDAGEMCAFMMIAKAAGEHSEHGGFLKIHVASGRIFMI